MSNFCGKCGKPLDTDNSLCTECASESEPMTKFPIIDEATDKEAAILEIKAVRKRFLVISLLILLSLLAVTLIVLGIVKITAPKNSEAPISQPVIIDEPPTDKDIYSEKIKEYTNAIIGKYELSEAEGKLSDPTAKFGYAYIDLNDDGTNELIVGEINGDSEFFVMYTIFEGKIECLYRYESDKYYYLNENNEIIVATYENKTDKDSEETAEDNPSDVSTNNNISEDPAEKIPEESSSTETVSTEDPEMISPSDEEDTPRIISFKKEILTSLAQTEIIDEIIREDSESDIWYDSNGNSLPEDAIEAFSEKQEIEYTPFPTEENEKSDNTNNIPESSNQDEETTSRFGSQVSDQQLLSSAQ